MSADGMQPEDVDRVFAQEYLIGTNDPGYVYNPQGDDHEPSDLPEVDDDTDPDWDLDDSVYLTS